MYTDLNPAQRANLILRYLKEDYPNVRSPLYHRNAFEFLIAVMLSPQTNDNTTNKVLPVLFDNYASPKSLAMASEDDVVRIIRPINFNKTKASRIIKVSKTLVGELNSKVPHKLEDIMKLPGVGRKVGNVIINDWYATPESENEPYELMENRNEYNSVMRGSVPPSGFVVDTHVLRVSRALGLTNAKSPDKVEKDLTGIFDMTEWMGTSLRMIFHGREVFQAKNPRFANFPKWNEIYRLLGY